MNSFQLGTREGKREDHRPVAGVAEGKGRVYVSVHLRHPIRI